jgi:hypothetical protein
MKSKLIPTYIIEEHHEAFIVWHDAIQKGYIPPIGNVLFHVDEHSDMGTPRFNTSIHELNGDLNVIKDFTYKELNIASFIMPALYENIFNQIHWIRQKHRKPEVRHEEMYIRSYNQSGKRLMSGKINTLKETVTDPDRKYFDYFLRTVEQIPNEKKVVLDIDLDYFSCSGNPLELNEINIEITIDEYNEFISNKYHPIKFSGLGRIEAVKKAEQYYFIINNYNETYTNELQVSEESIIQRIEKFLMFLTEKKCTPVLINICRSRFSGYTPKDQWEFIEQNLFSYLNSMYNIELNKVL